EVLDRPLTKQEVNQLKNQLDLKEDIRYLIFVGQLIPRKGVDILLRSLEFLNDPNTEVLIIGMGPEFENLKSIAQNPAITNKVFFLGKQSKDVVLKYLKVADLFVFPSREDIWGLVLNEAIGNALPVISTTRVGSAFSIIDQGKNGLIIEADNPVLLAQAINNILSEDLEMMKKASLNIAKKYTIEEMVREHLILFNKVKY
ncbi:MAG: glycosyltransferase family 1 protein, partial [Chryseobacterium sp.]